MFDFVAQTPFVLTYMFVLLLLLILCFIVVNVAHKIHRAMKSPIKLPRPSAATAAAVSAVAAAAATMQRCSSDEASLHTDQCQPQQLIKNKPHADADPFIEQLEHNNQQRRTKTG